MALGQFGFESEQRDRTDATVIAEFCRLYGLSEELKLAVRQAMNCFRPDEILFELSQDHETDDRWVVVRVCVSGSVENVLAAKKEYTARWVAAVPWPKRHLIRLSYSIN